MASIALRSLLVEEPFAFRLGSFPAHRLAPKPLSLSNPPSRAKCMALPKAAETLLHRFEEIVPQTSVEQVHNVVLQKANQLGLPIPADAVSWWALVAPIVLYYMFATPGMAAGLVDFIYAPLHVSSLKSFSPEEVEIGRSLGEGSFGVVYEGFFGRGKKDAKSEPLHVVLKKVKKRVKGASEIHNSEIYMNYRLQRTAPLACAEFLGTMQVSSSQAHGKLSEGSWLVWNFQGDRSLDYYLKQKNFPENVSSMILSQNFEVFSREEVFRRNSAAIQTIFRQILNNLQDLHRSGVVHRDVKPLNLILDQDCGKFKFIDFGACVDLRSGYNYSPDETVIDPTYAAPEHYIMPTSTPRLPPDPLCSLVSPVLWHLNTPDRFDLYSAGLIFMQLTMKPLRNDTGLQALNSELKRNGYDLNNWRVKSHYGKEEFAYLDADDGAGWELARALLQPRHDKDFFIWPSLWNSRPSASEALHHRYFKGTFSLPSFAPKLPSGSWLHLPPLASMSEKVTSALSPSPSIHQVVKARNTTPVVSPSSPPLPQQGLPSSVMITEKLSNLFGKGAQKDDKGDVATKGQRPAVETLETSNLQNSVPVLSAATRKLTNAVHSALKYGGSSLEDPKTQISSRSVEGLFEKQQEEGVKSQADVAKVNSSVLGSLGPSLPYAAAGGITLAMGWMLFTGLDSSAHASYEFGKVLMSSSALSGSAFVAFFYLIKPWLEQQTTSPRSMVAAHGETSYILDTKEKEVLREQYEVGTVKIKEKFRSRYSQQVVKLQLVEAVQELESQMSLLEELIVQEQHVAQQQQGLARKMEELLLQPSTVNLSQEFRSHLQAEPSSTHTT